MTKDSGRVPQAAPGCSGFAASPAVSPSGEHPSRGQGGSVGVERVLINVAASLAAAISLLERGGKKAAPSDRMFEQMLADYRASLSRARACLNSVPMDETAEAALAVEREITANLTWAIERLQSEERHIRDVLERVEWWLSTIPEGQAMRDVCRAALASATEARRAEPHDG